MTIQIAQQARIDFSLEVGSVQQTLEVTAAAPLLQTENSTLGSVVGTERTVDLPLNGRQFDNLAVLTPGVVRHQRGSAFIEHGRRADFRQRTAPHLGPGQRRRGHDGQ